MQKPSEWAILQTDTKTFGERIVKKILNTKWFTLSTYILLLLAILLVGFVFLQHNQTLKNVVTAFFEVAENRTFDYRQSIKIAHKQPVPNKDIVVLAVDEDDGDGICFTVVSDQLFWLRVLPGDTAKMDSSKEDSGRTCGPESPVSFCCCC